MKVPLGSTLDRVWQFEKVHAWRLKALLDMTTNL